LAVSERRQSHVAQHGVILGPLWGKPSGRIHRPGQVVLLDRMEFGLRIAKTRIACSQSGPSKTTTENTGLLEARYRFSRVIDEDSDDEGDGDWSEPQEDQTYEPLEYDSDDESSHAEVDLQDIDVEMMDIDEASQDESLTREQLRRFWLEGMMETHGGQWAHKESFEALVGENDMYRASFPLKST
jgi:hypothetical protein